MRSGQDFIHDQLSDGRNIRLFNVIDDYNRQGLDIDVDFPLPSSRVVRALDQRSLNGEGNHRSYAATTARNISARWAGGQRTGVSGFNSFSQEARSRTPMWSAITGPSDMTGSTNISLKQLRRCRTRPQNGSGHITMNGPIWSPKILRRNNANAEIGYVDHGRLNSSTFEDP